MSVTIYTIEDANEVTDKDGKPVPFLTYYKPHKGQKVIAENADKATLDELAELCDRDAEAKNRHAFCGAHEALGLLLLQHVPKAKATEIMRAIAHERGLHGMNGQD